MTMTQRVWAATFGYLFFITVCHVVRASTNDTSRDVSLETSFQAVSTAMSHDRIGQGWNEIFQTVEFAKALIDRIFENYDSRIPPSFELDKAASVTLQVYVLSIDTVSETNMDFAISMFLRQSWVDPRVNYTEVPGMRSLELDINLMSKVWVPDTYMPAEKSANVHDVTVPNKLMHIKPGGKIQYSQRVSAVLKCNFDLRKYPLDSQHCVVEFESYGYTTETLNLKWHETPLELQKHLKVPQFTIADLKTSRCDKVFVGVGYTCVSFEFHLHRSMGYYITQVYIPSYLIVFLSWVSFWLDIDAVPARISLGLLTVLTMTTQSSGARANLPKVSYVKAIDVWMATCLAFVFLALVQFAYVNVLSRVEKRRKTKNVGKLAAGALMQSTVDSSTIALVEKSKSSNNSAPVTAAKASFLRAARQATENKKQETETADVEKQALDDTEDQKNQKEKAKFLNSIKGLKLKTILSADREKARNVDRISRYLFPFIFLVFNIIYWCVYVFWEPERDE